MFGNRRIHSSPILGLGLCLGLLSQGCLGGGGDGSPDGPDASGSPQDEDCAASRETSCTVSVGTLLRGAFEAPRDQDWYKIRDPGGPDGKLEGGRSYLIDLKGVGDLDISGTLYRGAGSFKRGIHATRPYPMADERLVYTPPANATYYLGLCDAVEEDCGGSVGAFRRGRANYTVSLKKLPPDCGGDSSTACLITVGSEPTEGFFEGQEDEDWYRLELRGGRSYALSLSMTDSRDPEELGGQGSLYDAMGMELPGTGLNTCRPSCSEGSSSTASYTTPTGEARYYLRLRFFNESGSSPDDFGVYRIQVTETP